MNLLLVAFVFTCGAVCSAVATRALIYHLVVMPAQRDRDAYLEIARKATTDVRLVKALRAGEIGLDELLEVGVLDESASSPGSPTLTLGESRALPELEPGTYPALGPGPRFIPNFYRRAPKVDDLTPGDEAWVNLYYVDADRRGNPVVYRAAATEMAGSKVSGPSGRLRVYEDGSLELGTYALDVAGSDMVETDDGRYRPIARVVNLDTKETRELQVTDSTQPDT